MYVIHIQILELLRVMMFASFRACKGVGRRMQTRRAHSTLSAGEVSRAAIYHRQCWLQTCGLVFCYFSRPPTKKLCAATNWPDSRTRACPSRRIHRRNDSLLPNKEYWHGKHKNPLVLVNWKPSILWSGYLCRLKCAGHCLMIAVSFSFPPHPSFTFTRGVLVNGPITPSPLPGNFFSHFGNSESPLLLEVFEAHSVQAEGRSATWLHAGGLVLYCVQDILHQSGLWTENKFRHSLDIGTSSVDGNFCHYSALCMPRILGQLVAAWMPDLLLQGHEAISSRHEFLMKRETARRLRPFSHDNVPPIYIP